MRKISVLGADVEAIVSLEGEATPEMAQRVSELVRQKIQFAMTMEMEKLFAAAMQVVDSEHPAHFLVRPSAALEHVFVAFSAGWNQFLQIYFGEISEVVVARTVNPIELFDQWKVDPDSESEILSYSFPYPLSELIKDMRAALVDEVLADGHYKIQLPPVWKELLLNVYTHGWNACRQALGGKG